MIFRIVFDRHFLSEGVFKEILNFNVHSRITGISVECRFVSLLQDKETVN